MLANLTKSVKASPALVIALPIALAVLTAGVQALVAGQTVRGIVIAALGALVAAGGVAVRQLVVPTAKLTAAQKAALAPPRQH